MEKVKPTDIPLLALSGSVKVVGEASKVSVCICYLSRDATKVCLRFIYSSLVLLTISFRFCLLDKTPIQSKMKQDFSGVHRGVRLVCG